MAPTSGAGRRYGADIRLSRRYGADIRLSRRYGADIRLSWRFLLKIGQLHVGDGAFGRVTGDGGVVADGGQAAGVEALGRGLAGRWGRWRC